MDSGTFDPGDGPRVEPCVDLEASGFTDSDLLDFLAEKHAKTDRRTCVHSIECLDGESVREALARELATVRMWWPFTGTEGAEG